ncbi:hypothetical protein [Methylotenera sp.]|uniref:hypothetical protein n=1 Tax=Methylotenera sp. TaxID=2051956 RepID=UPI002EDB9639
MRTKLANFYKLLRVWDGFWSIPLLLCIWALSDITGRFYFGDAWAGYDPSIFQSVVIAAVLVSSINTLATGGIMFTFRDLYQYMYSEQYKTDLDNLENNGAWRRVLLSKAVYFGFFLLIAFVLKQILTPFATA